MLVTVGAVKGSRSQSSVETVKSCCINGLGGGLSKRGGEEAAVWEGC